MRRISQPGGAIGRAGAASRNAAARAANGSLVIVGAGISLGQMTLQSLAHISESDCVLALVCNPIVLQWLKRKNPATESLEHLYHPSKLRSETYSEMVNLTMARLHEGKSVCLVLYGHPGVFTNPSHVLMQRTQAEGIPSLMLPGISAEDCLFADLGVDPGRSGCQSYEATDFVRRQPRFDPAAALILWQFAIIDEKRHPRRCSRRGVKKLMTLLREVYGANHRVVVYEAAPFPMCSPKRDVVALKRLPKASFTSMSTLYVPPIAAFSTPARAVIKVEPRLKARQQDRMLRQDSELDQSDR